MATERSMTKIPQPLIFKIGKWLEGRKEEMAKGKWTLDTLAIAIGKDFQIKCTAYNVRGLLEALEMPIPRGPRDPNRVGSIYYKLEGRVTALESADGLKPIQDRLDKMETDLVALRNMIQGYHERLNKLERK